MVSCATNRYIFPLIFWVFLIKKKWDISSKKQEAKSGEKKRYFPHKSGNVDTCMFHHNVHLAHPTVCSIGIQLKEGIHRGTGPTSQHPGRHVESCLGTERPVNCDADQVCGERTGMSLGCSLIHTVIKTLAILCKTNMYI